MKYIFILLILHITSNVFSMEYVCKHKGKEEAEEKLTSKGIYQYATEIIPVLDKSEVQQLLDLASEELKDFYVWDHQEFEEHFPPASLILGSEGTGKSSLAYAIAQKFNNPIELIDCSKLAEHKNFGRYNLHSIIGPMLSKQAIPRVIIFDNIDVWIEAHMKLHGRSLQMSPFTRPTTTTSHKIIFTAKSPDSLDDELKDNLCDGVYEINKPTLQHRIKIIKHIFNKHGYDCPDQEIRFAADNTNDFSLKELNNLTKQVIANIKPRRVITKNDLQKICAKYSEARHSGLAMKLKLYGPHLAGIASLGIVAYALYKFNLTNSIKNRLID